MGTSTTDPPGKKTRGWQQAGPGRPKDEPLVRIYVPLGLEGLVRRLVKAYRQMKKEGL